MRDLAICSGNEPNVVPVVFKDVTDDGKLVAGDVFLETTLNNIRDNGNHLYRNKEVHSKGCPGFISICGMDIRSEVYEINANADLMEAASRFYLFDLCDQFFACIHQT